MKGHIPFDKKTATAVKEWLDWLRTPTTPAVPINVDGRTDRAAWLERRRQGVGASDIAAVLGLSPWTSPFALWWEKHLGWDLPPTDAMADGLRVEEWAHEEFVKRHPELYVARPGFGLYADSEREWMLCTPDFLAVDYLPKPLTFASKLGESDAYIDRARQVLPRPTVSGEDVVVRPVEVKSDSHGDWGMPGTDEVPDRYALQLKWQCHILGADGGWLVRRKTVGDRRYSEYYVPYEMGELDYAIGEGAKFMTSLELGHAPDPDASTATLEALKRINPAPDADRIATIDWGLAEDWARARQRKAEIAEAVKLYDNEMREAMGGAEQAMTPDGTIVARRRIGKRAGYEVGPCETDELRMVKSGAGSEGSRVRERRDRYRPTAESDDGGAAEAVAEEGDGCIPDQAGELRGTAGSRSEAAAGSEGVAGGAR